ncbi:unnamed protein product [Cochlearia groenlandica]
MRIDGFNLLRTTATYQVFPLAINATIMKLQTIGLQSPLQIFGSNVLLYKNHTLYQYGTPNEALGRPPTSTPPTAENQPSSSSFLFFTSFIEETWGILKQRVVHGGIVALSLIKRRSALVAARIYAAGAKEVMSSTDFIDFYRIRSHRR